MAGTAWDKWPYRGHLYARGELYDGPKTYDIIFVESDLYPEAISLREH